MKTEIKSVVKGVFKGVALENPTRGVAPRPQQGLCPCTPQAFKKA